MHLARRLVSLLLGTTLLATPLVLVAPAQADPIPRVETTLTGWGSDWAGQAAVPASLTGMTVTAISGGWGHSLAATSDGGIVGFGLDDHGQTTIPDSLTGRSVTGVGAGYQFSLALTSDGVVTAWGSNSSGQVGVPSSLGGQTVTAVAAGQYHSLALTSDGKITGWGYNADGQLDVPESVAAKTVTAIAAGPYSTLALTSDGTVTAWGYNGWGQSNVPESLTGKTVTAIASGGSQSLAATSDGQVTAWGNSPAVPESLTGKTVTAVAAGYDYALALSSDGVVTAWGNSPATTVASSLTGRTVTAIAAGSYHGLAITTPAAVDTGVVGDALSTVAGTPVAFTPELSGTLEDPSAWTITDAGHTDDVDVTVDPTTGRIVLDSTVVGTHELTLTIPSEGGDFVAAITLSVTAARVVPAATTLTVVAAKGLVMRGSRTRVRIAGLDPSEPYRLTIGRRVAASGVAGSDGTVNRRVRVPARTSEGRRLVKVIGSQADRAGTTRLYVVRKKLLGLRLGTSTVQASDSQRVRVFRLAPRERVRVLFQGRRISPRGSRADAQGVFAMTFQVGIYWGAKTVKVTGKFAGRRASRTFTVVRRADRVSSQLG